MNNAQLPGTGPRALKLPNTGSRELKLPIPELPLAPLACSASPSETELSRLLFFVGLPEISSSASMVLANLRLSLANPPDFYTFTSRNCSGFHKMKFGLGKSAGANDAGERFVQAHIVFLEPCAFFIM
jgi:hypothetical protein